jgi:hypothetical protein
MASDIGRVTASVSKFMFAVHNIGKRDEAQTANVGRV